MQYNQSFHSTTSSLLPLKSRTFSQSTRESFLLSLIHLSAFFEDFDYRNITNDSRHQLFPGRRLILGLDAVPLFSGLDYNRQYHTSSQIQDSTVEV